MDKELIKKAFREFKKEAKADYSITAPDRYGDCQTCVNFELADVYGEKSTGIWLKHWRYGMNKGGSIKSLDKCYIAHDITPDQASTLVKVFKKYFKIYPTEYDETKCFQIMDKNATLYELTYTQNDNGITYKNIYLSKEDAEEERTWLYDSKIGKHIYIREV